MNGEPAPPPVESPVDTPHGPVFWISFTVGTAVCIRFGLIGMLRDLPSAELRRSFVEWVVGVDLVHDAVLAPFVALVGVLVTRALPRALRPPAQFALVAGACVAFVALNPLRRSAAFKHNPSFQPLDYASATITVLGVIGAIAVAWAASSALRSHRAARR